MNECLKKINQEYLKLHKAKEDLYWTIYMGVESDTHLLEKAEINYKAFISDTQNLKTVQSALKNTNNDAEFKALKGWDTFFQAQEIPSLESKQLQKELIALESEIFKKRSQYSLTFIDENGKEKNGSTRVLSTNLSHDSLAVRQSSFKALQRLEDWVVENALPKLITKRNEFAKSMGYANYFDFAIEKNEQMSTQELFDILDTFKEKTQKGMQELVDNVSSKNGESAIKAYNFKYHTSGEITKELDPYFPFEKALERWVNTFENLGVSFRGAKLTLDLLDRKGKYENGFMHAPTPCFYTQTGEWIPAEINFTSNAYPTQVGSGYMGLHTLLHEGGHAAHFSNITQGAPCFSQEYFPTSMAYAETQSMFFDSLLEDSHWLKKYAKDLNGHSIPDDLIKKNIHLKQPLKVFSERSILVVPYLEHAIYSQEITDPTSLKKLARAMEKDILKLEEAPRPLLTIPHLLGGESACCYQGYLLAHMAVYQTRDFFLSRDGYLVDNPNIGPELSKKYWSPGNSISHSDTLKRLCGQGFDPNYLAKECNLKPHEKWSKEETQLSSAFKVVSEDLNATIKVVHGKSLLASNKHGSSQFYQEFENSIQKLFPRSSI
jgi:Zn-dependent oligopeptidase